MAVPGGGSEKAVELVGVPCLVFDRGDGSQHWGMGDECDVAGEQAAFDRVSQGSTDDLVDLEHHLGAYARPPSVGWSIRS